VIKLSESQIAEVMEKTGASRELVEKVALWIPGQYIRFAAIKTWSCARCLTCLGLVRKVMWCIICAAARPPELEVKPKSLVKSTIKPRVGITIPEPSLVPTGYWRGHVLSTEEIAKLPEDRLLTAPLTK